MIWFALPAFIAPSAMITIATGSVKTAKPAISIEVVYTSPIDRRQTQIISRAGAKDISEYECLEGIS
jgi:hypothetical protein